MRVSGLQSNSCSRRIGVLLVAPLKEDETTSMIGSVVSAGVV